MRILKGILLTLCLLLLGASQLGTAWSFVGLKTVHDRATVKSWLTDGDFYDSLTDVVLDNIEQTAETKNNTGRVGDNIPVDDPRVKAIVKQALSADFLQKSSESILDGVYDWLDGKTSTLAFSIDTSSVKNQLITGIGSYATEKAADMPPCGPGQISADFDPFTSTCLPPGVTAQMAGQAVTNDLLSDSEFLEKTTVSGADIKVEESGRKIPISESEQGARIKKAYELSSFLPLAMGALVILTAVVVIFISHSRGSGIRSAGVMTLLSGLALSITYAALAKGPELIQRRVEKSDNNVAAIMEVVNTITRDIRSNLLWFAVGYVVVGIAMIIGGSLMGRKGGSGHDDKSKDENPVPVPPTPETPSGTLPPDDTAPAPGATPTTAPPVPHARPAGPKPVRKIQL